MANTATWFLKDCPKCGGDLYLDPLVSGDTVKCLQCGLEVKLSFLYLGKKTVAEGDVVARAGEEIAAAKEEPVIKKRKRATATSRL